MPDIVRRLGGCRDGLARKPPPPTASKGPLMRRFREVPGHRLVATGGGVPSEIIFTRRGEPKDALRC